MFSNWRLADWRFPFPSKERTKASRTGARFRPLLEALEDRRLLTALGVNDQFFTDESIALLIDAPGVLANDGTAGSLIAVLNTGTHNGSLTFSANGSFAYTPNPEFAGTDSFTYFAFDLTQGLLSEPVTVSITVLAVNDAPIGRDDGYLTLENKPLTVAAGVLTNDSEPDGANLLAVLDTGPAHGSLNLSADGSFSYSPDPGFHGSDSFTYLASDGVLTSAPVTVTIDVIALPSPIIVTGAGAGRKPSIKVFEADSKEMMFDIQAFPAKFRGGVRVAAGDVNGDSYDDVIAGTGAGITTRVKIFDGRDGSPIRNFRPFGAAARGGVWVAAGDVDGDGLADIITGAGVGARPRVKVFSGEDGSVIHRFRARGFRGGVRVAAGDVDGDGLADIIAGAARTGSHVQVFSGADFATLANFKAFDQRSLKGVFVAAGDVDGDGLADVIAGPGTPNGQAVKIFFQPASGSARQAFALGAVIRGGAHVGTVDWDGDGIAEIVTGPGPGMGSDVKIFEGLTATELDSFFAGSAGGMSVAGS